MSLPILVPTALELPLLGMAFHVRHVCRRLCWRARVATPRTSPPFPKRRSHRFGAQSSAESRAERLAHWQWTSTKFVMLAKPPTRVPTVWRPRTRLAFRSLLRRGEVLLKLLLWRRQRAAGVSPSALERLATTFDARTWRVTVGPEQREVFVFMLISMYWRGCRHPASLWCPPLHPSTALVRWVSHFPVNHQVEHGREILGQFAAQEARVHDFACQLADRLVPKSALLARTVPLLPEMLRTIESEFRSDSCDFTTLT